MTFDSDKNPPPEQLNEPAALHQHRWQNFLLVAIAFLLLVWPTLFKPKHANAGVPVHMPAIRQLAAQWPNLDLVNYANAPGTPPGEALAMTPGYQIAMAALFRFVSSDIIVLKLITSLSGLALLLYLVNRFSRNQSGLLPAALCMPLICSSYFVLGCSDIGSDMPALLFSMIAQLECLEIVYPRRRIILAGLSTMLAVAIRQNAIWPVAPIFTSGFFTLRSSESTEAKLGTIFATIVALAMPILMLAYFVKLWGGLTPPAIESHPGWRPESGVFVFSVIGLSSICCLPLLINLARQYALPLKMLAALALLGILMALVPTQYSQIDGRWGGWLWEASKSIPSVQERNLLFFPLAAAGTTGAGILVSALIKQGKVRECAILTAGFTLWLLSQAMAFRVFQRYVEPYVLIVFLVFLSYQRLDRKQAYSCLLLLSCLHLAVTIVKIYK